ncbi:MAG: hypothetical protein ABIN93_06330, partial [Ginsengibacter sp.]
LFARLLPINPAPPVIKILFILIFAKQSYKNLYQRLFMDEALAKLNEQAQQKALAITIYIKLTAYNILSQSACKLPYPHPDKLVERM